MTTMTLIMTMLIWMATMVSSTSINYVRMSTVSYKHIMLRVSTIKAVILFFIAYVIKYFYCVGLVLRTWITKIT